jgi:uncharacterized protein (TIGR00369 family)
MNEFQTPSGIDYFRAMAAGEIPRTPMGELLDLRITEVEEGRVVFVAEATAAHNNTTGYAHGGFAATLLDSAMGCAINTMSPQGKVYTTVELKINYMRPIHNGVGQLRCEGKILHVGKRVGTAEGRVFDSQGKLYAHGSTTCIAIEI